MRSDKADGSPLGEAILYKCPNTGLNVQHRLADVPESENAHYSSIACPACTRVHFIHNRTGKLLGDK